MKAMKRLAWTLPAAALVVGALTLVNGLAVTTAADLPAPVGSALTADQMTAAPVAVDGETWTAMRIKGSATGI